MLVLAVPLTEVLLRGFGFSSELHPASGGDAGGSAGAETKAPERGSAGG